MKTDSRLILFAVLLSVTILTQALIYFLFISFMVEKPLKTEKGVLDLSGWDFQEHGPVKLDGEWEFYWKKLLKPENLYTARSGLEKDFIHVPGLWNGHPTPEGTISGKGYATYCLTIKNVPQDTLYALKIPDINTSYKLWINDDLVASNGMVGKNASSAVPQYLPQITVFNTDSDTLQIIIQVSNFCYSLGGVWKSLLLGNEKQIIKIRENKKSFEFILIGTLLVMGIYHLGLYLLGKKEYAMMYFGLFCLLIMSRTLLTGERIFIEAFPGMNWELALKMELLPVFLGPPIFLFFLQSLYPQEVNRKVLYFFIIIESLGSVIIFALSPDQFELPFITYQVLLLIISAYCLYILIMAFKNKQKGAGFLIAGYIVLFSTIVNDVMYSQFVIQTDYLLPFGLTFFILFAFALQKKFVQAEISLKVSEEKNKALLRALPDSMFQINSKGYIKDYKSAGTKGVYTFDENIEGKNIYDILPKNTADDFSDLLKQVMKAGSYHVREQDFTVNGKRLSFEIRAVKSDSDKAIAIVRDVSEKKQAEEKARDQQQQLIQADKMVALGTLVAGVAHEINNPNNAIMLTTQVLSETWDYIYPVIDEYVDETGDLQLGGRSYREWKKAIPDDFSRIIRNSKRIKNIVNDLKTYAKKDTGDLNEDVDINSVVKSSLRIISNKINSSTNVFSVAYGKDIPKIKGSIQKLEQVIINLTLNACQALTDIQNRVSVSTMYDHTSRKVIITVCDEGIGMDQDTLKKIFDPFFTTKKDASGIGLGLSISAKIVKEHKGTLTYESTPGKGTTASIVFGP